MVIEPLAACFAIAALGILVVACFPTQTVASVLPPGVERTTTGRLHDLGAFVVMVALFAATLIASSTIEWPAWFRRWALALLAFAVIVGGALLAGGDDVGGLRQRLLVLTGCAAQAALLVAFGERRSGRDGRELVGQAPQHGVELRVAIGLPVVDQLAQPRGCAPPPIARASPSRAPGHPLTRDQAFVVAEHRSSRQPVAAPRSGSSASWRDLVGASGAPSRNSAQEAPGERSIPARSSTLAMNAKVRSRPGGAAQRARELTHGVGVHRPAELFADRTGLDRLAQRLLGDQPREQERDRPSPQVATMKTRVQGVGEGPGSALSPAAPARTPGARRRSRRARRCPASRRSSGTASSPTSRRRACRRASRSGPRARAPA